MAVKLFLCCLLHATLGYTASYQISLLNPLEEEIKEFLARSLSRYTPHQSPALDSAVVWLWGLLNATLTFSFMISSLFLKPVVESLGRKTACCVLQPILLITGALLMASAKHTNMFELLFFGHVLTGVAYTLTNFCLVFVAECAPVQYRAAASNLMYLGSPLWLCIGSILGLPHVLGSSHRWPYAVGLPAVPSLLYLFIAFPVVHESPKFLRITRADQASAAHSIRFYHGEDADVAQVELEIDREAQLDAGSTSLGLAEIARTRHYRWPFLIVTVVGIANQAGASSIVRSYSTQILRLGFDMDDESAALSSGLLVSWPTVLACCLGLLLGQKCSRRMHLLASLLVADTGMLMLFAARFTASPKHYTVLGIAGMCMSIWSYFGGVGSIGGYIAAELCSQSTRSLASSARFIARGVTAVAQLQLYPVLSASVGAWALIICSVQDVFCFVFLALYLPETKGKTVDEVLERWIQPPEEEVPLREFFDQASYSAQ